MDFFLNKRIQKNPQQLSFRWFIVLGIQNEDKVMFCLLFYSFDAFLCWFLLNFQIIWRKVIFYGFLLGGFYDFFVIVSLFVRGKISQSAFRNLFESGLWACFFRVFVFEGKFLVSLNQLTLQYRRISTLSIILMKILYYAVEESILTTILNNSNQSWVQNYIIDFNCSISTLPASCSQILHYQWIYKNYLNCIIVSSYS